jgi:hypothetical protein
MTPTQRHTCMTLERATALMCVLLAAPWAIAAPATPSAPPIYKLVDAQGRITYTNAPVKGAVKVELDPITVIPATPGGSLGGATPPVASALPPAPILIPVQPIPAAAPAVSPSLSQAPAVTITPTTSPTAVAAQPKAIFPAASNVATVTPISKAQLQSSNGAAPQRASVSAAAPSNLPVVKLSPSAPVAAPAAVPATPAATPAVPTDSLAAPTFPAAPVVVAAAPPTAPVPRIDSRKAEALASAIQREEQLLTDARAQLTEEKRASDSFRGLRAGLAAKPDSNNPQAAAIKADIKAQVERHFERVRDLEDQVSMHQRNIEQYRQQARTG